MGIMYNENVEENKLYKAYGITVYGKVNKYSWSIYPDKADEDCIIFLRLEKNGEEFFRIHLGNNCIMKENFDRTIDNFLWHVNKENPDRFDLENGIFNTLCQANSLFNHMIEQHKRREQKEVDDKHKREEREKEIKNMIKYISAECENKDWLFYTRHYDSYGECIVFAPKNDKAREAILNALESDNNEKLKFYVEFSDNYPDNKDLDVKANGQIDEVYQMFKEGKVK